MRAAAQSPQQKREVYRWAGEAFCRRVLRHGLCDATCLYTFSNAGLELIHEAKARGMHTIVEQYIAPYVAADLLAQEEERYPDWESAEMGGVVFSGSTERSEQEWRAADRVLCASDFVRDAIASHGGPAEKCAVVPYGVDADFEVPGRVSRPGPLRVLTVGAVGLRKGSPYVLEAARRMNVRATFRMVGPVRVLPKAEALLRSHVELTGPVPRSEIRNHFEWADVFLLPSVCEGSATVTYEALAAGLPVICTPNTGSVVRDGVDGAIVPIRRPDLIVEKLEEMSDAATREAMSGQARRRYSEYTLERYAVRLIAEVRKLHE